MPDIRVLLLVALALLGLYFVARWIRTVVAGMPGQSRAEILATARPTAWEAGIGFVTNFLDTLGIGSFAPTTSMFKIRHMVPDEEIPGTMHIGHGPPVIVQAFIFISIVQVEIATLVAMIGAAVAGAWLGAGVVARLPRRSIQFGMGIALLTAAGFFVLSIFEFFPAGGDALGLSGGFLAVAAAVSFVLGALMTIGVGIYAPSMIMVSLFGMNPVAAFPIMMGASAFLMAAASLRFLDAKRYDLGAAVGLTVGGLPAVLIAAFVVKSLPLDAMRWLVVAVVVYAAVSMLRSAFETPARDAATSRVPPASAA